MLPDAAVTEHQPGRRSYPKGQARYSPTGVLQNGLDVPRK
jgi:hypothetical protein